MVRGFTIIDHPADLGIEAHGRTLAEAFEQSAHALMSIILDCAAIEPVEKRAVELTATDIEQLLVKWLAEILYLYDGCQFAAKEFVIDHLDTVSLKATVIGEPMQPAKHPTKLDVKAITYHQLRVTEDNNGSQVRVFLDI